MILACDSCGQFETKNDTEEKMNFLIILDRTFDPSIKGRRIINDRELYICPECRKKILMCINVNRKGPAMRPIDI